MGSGIKKLNKAIAYLDGVYKTIPKTKDKEIVLTVLKRIEKRHDIIVETLITIEVPEL